MLQPKLVFCAAPHATHCPHDASNQAAVECIKGPAAFGLHNILPTSPASVLVIACPQCMRASFITFCSVPIILREWHPGAQEG